ncbi:hypothetical protein MYX82_05705 [Acidobacteria bacterium AH-259-D05]|nr:hypothetical protein [Acidobacteria bacterium AH-259-D05]
MYMRILQLVSFLFFMTLLCILFVASVESRNNGQLIPSSDGVLSDMPCFVSGCHNTIGGSLNTNGSVQFNNLPGTFVPGMTYDIGITITGGTVYGFQLAAVFSDNTQAGTLTPVTSGVTTTTANGVRILVHSPSPLNSGTVNFQWSAPTDPKENAVIFKVASNSANGNFSNTGDSINTLQATVPQQAGPELTEKLFFAQFGNGQGLTSDIVLTNPSTTLTATGKVDFLDDNGLSFSVAVVGTGETTSVDFSILPLGTVTISTDGQGEITVGSAVVSSDSTLGGVVRFNISGIGIAGVGASQPLSGFITPARRKSGGINTGVAIHNTENQAVTLNFMLQDTQGTLVPNGTRTIADFPAGGHLAQFIGGEGGVLFPDANTDDFEGTLVVQVTGGNVATATLELGTQAGEFTTLPVTPLE